MAARPSGTVTFLFTDIQGSTLLWEADQKKMRNALEQHDRLVRDAVESRGGYVFSTAGDAFSVAFQTEASAIDATLSSQLALQRAEWGDLGRLKVRMALHTGTAQERDGNYFGPTLNRTARILSVAGGDEVLVSSATQTRVDGDLPAGVVLIDIGEFRLKDLGRSDRVFLLKHPDLIETTVDLDETRRIRGYKVIEKIGEGGFGVVYRARQEGVERDVAIKAIRPEYANDPRFIRRFDGEAQLVARLEHPFIVPLYDYWREPNGAYLVMRWLRGGNLQSALRRGPWSLAASARMFRQVGDALAVAHRSGVVHRDLKPANILLDEEGNAYLSDFGIARDLAAAVQLEALDESIDWPAYASPEQLTEQADSQRSDIYSLGLVLYEMLTGRYPFGQSRPSELLGLQVEARVPETDDLAPGVAAIIERATARDPADRYSDVETLVDDLERQAGLPEPSRPTVAATPSRNPYKGLQAFQQADAGDFFGRDILIQQVVGELQKRRLVTVVGPSGSGKSSVVKAGVLPSLRSGAVSGWQDWFFTEMVPGAHPFEELEAALLRVAVNPPSSLLEQLESDERGLIRAGARVLPDGNQELVLLIDQFEEVFSLVTDPEVRVRFLQTLLAVAQEEQSRVRLILTLRADFFDQPLLYPEFADVIKAGLVTVTPLSGDELEEAIVAPGRKVGASFETGLVGDITSDVLGQPGALPLLQYALTELFERQDGGVLTRAVYRDLGGVTGALGMRAEEIYTSLDPAGEEAARQVFLRLVTLGEGTGDTRRRVARSELDQLTAGADAVAAVVDAFGGHRLLSFDRDPATRRPTVEVAHESLLREWPRLREWIDLGRDDVRTQRRIATATADWSDADGDESFLLTGARLERIEAWAGSTSIALTEEESAFVKASITRRNELEALDAERAAREAALERRAARRMRVLVAVLGVGLFVAAGLSFFAFNQRSEAQAQARLATAQGLAAAAIADLDSDPELSLLLALEGAEVSRSAGEAVIPEIEDALHQSLQAQRSLLTLPEASAGALSPDGTRLVTGGPANTAVIRDADSGVVLFALEGHSAPVVQSLFSPDGAQVATASEDGSVRIWDTGTGLFLRRIDAHRSLVRGITYAADGSLLASFGGDNQARVWDPRTGALVDSFSVLDQIGGVAFSPDGEQWAVASILGATALDVHSTERTTVTEGPTCGVDYSPDGNGLALGTEQGVVELWDLSAVEPAIPTQTLAGHTDLVCGLAISADGSMIASGGDDGLVKIWDVETGDEILTLAGHSGGVRSVELAPDGGSLLSTSRDGTTKRWDITLEGGRELLTADVGGPVGFVDFSPDGSRVMTFSVPPEEDGLDELVTIWDVSEPPVAVQLAVPEFVTGPEVTFGFLSQDWTRGVLARVNGTLLLFDVGQGTPAPELTEVKTLSPPGGFGIISLNRDGSLLADIRSDRVSVIETDSSEEIFSVAPEFEPGPGASIGSFDAEGTHLLVGSAAGEVKVWNIETGDLVVDGSHSGSPAIRSLVAANGLMATGASDSTVQFWDMTAGDRIGGPLVHGGDITAVALSPDGKTLASTSTDGTVKLWDTTSGDEKLTLRGHRGLVTHVDFHPDGDKLVTSGLDGTIRIWTLDVDELIDLAKRRATRELTGGECRQYVAGDACGAD